MASTLQIDENHLRALKRPELQKLAREHKIKANLKSEVIIDLLLHRLADATKHQADNPSSVAQHANPMPPSVDDDNSRDRPGERLIAIPTNPNPRRSFATPRDAPPLNQQSKGSVCQSAGPSYPGSPPDIEHFDKEQLAAPEPLVRETVAMLAELDKGDQQLMDQIINMREAMSKLRSQTQNTRALLRSENARRRRAVQYYLYWHPITSNWSYEEVWSGKVKVRDDEDIVGFTTSDEEDWEEEKVGGNKTDPQNSHLYDSIINSIERIEENGASEAEALLSPIGVPVTDLETFNTIMGEKRLRSRSPSDDGRHAPRRRIEQQDYPETPEGGFNFISPPQTPLISARVDKGKAKMTTEQVEKLEREHAVERLLAEVAAEACHFPEVHDKTAGSNLEPTRERAAPEEHVVRDDDSNCHSEDGAAVLEVPPTDSHKEDGVEAECPKIVLDYNNPLATQPAKASTEVQAAAQTCIIEPGQNQEQENVSDRKALRTSMFSSASHQPRYIQRTPRKRKRAN